MENNIEGYKRMLLGLLEPDRKIYAIVTSVARSGMSRHIRFFIFKDGMVFCIDHSISRILGYSVSDKGVKVNGCGMDMGFHVVYSLGRVLFPNGDGKTVTGRNGDTQPEKDGGYLIKHIWM